jgi:two-component system, OmpR family, phosphate regulon response regulator PhoB
MSAILVIEDDPAAAKLLQVALGRKGHVVDVARDLASGKVAAGARRYDLLILDLFFPDGSGWDLLHHLREDAGVSAPVLLLSGHRQADFQGRAEAAGASGYVSKPFSIGHVLMEVDRLTG